VLSEVEQDVGEPLPGAPRLGALPSSSAGKSGVGIGPPPQRVCVLGDDLVQGHGVEGGMHRRLLSSPA
jgi:hypothetical protein